MEYDRYQKNHGMYFIAMVSLLLSLVLLLFSAYILPFLIWDLHYNVPEFVSYLLALLQEDYLMRPFTSKVCVALLFILPGVGSGLLAYYASNRIENAIFQVTEEEETEGDPQEQIKKSQARRESLVLALKLLFFMFLLVSAILFIQSIIWE